MATSSGSLFFYAHLMKPFLWDSCVFERHVLQCYTPGYTEVTQASKNLLLIYNTSFTKIKSSKIERLIEFDCTIFCVSSISFDCRTQSNSIHGLSSIGFDWVRLKFSWIGFDLLCRVLFECQCISRRALINWGHAPDRFGIWKCIFLLYSFFVV